MPTLTNNHLTGLPKTPSIDDLDASIRAFCRAAGGSVNLNYQAPGEGGDGDGDPSFTVAITQTVVGNLFRAIGQGRTLADAMVMAHHDAVEKAGKLPITATQAAA